MSNDGWTNNNDGVLPPPPISAISAAEAARKAQANAPSMTPTPEEVSKQVQARGIPATHDPVEHASPPSALPAPAPPRPGQEPPMPKRQPKYRMGSFLKIPGGFSGRVVVIYDDFESVQADPDVQAAGGVEVVLRGKQGTCVPSTYEQPFYRVTSNRFDFDLVVGELDAHLIQQGPGA